MTRKAIYFDKRYGLTSFLDNRIYEDRPSDYEVVDYYSISKWLEESGKGDIIVFAQDIIPYTAYNITPYSTDSKLLRFLHRGGIVVWVGDAPFFYRLHCFDKSVKGELEKTKEKLKKSVAFTPLPDFYLDKFGPYERGDNVCIMDIIGGFYADINEVTWLSLDYRHLNFYKLSEVCYLSSERYVTTTLIGKLLDYRSSVTVRPTKLTTRLYPLTLTTLEGVCKGKYAGSWIASVDSGFFVRLYDNKDDIDTKKVFDIGEKLSRLT